MTGSHEVRGSIPLGSTNHFFNPMKDQYVKPQQPETDAFEELGLDRVELPEWFEYPKSFKRVVRLELVDLEPWFIMNGARVEERIEGLKTRYPMRDLVPFARRGDNDDIACWERGKGETVVLIHDYTTPGYEEIGAFPNFWDWFRSAAEEMIEFDENGID